MLVNGMIEGDEPSLENVAAGADHPHALIRPPVSTTWHLRKPDGAVYGPVDLDTLGRWAADGRVASDDHVSPDGQAWQPATSVPALGLDWIVQLASGDLCVVCLASASV